MLWGPGVAGLMGLEEQVCAGCWEELAGMPSWQQHPLPACPGQRRGPVGTGWRQGSARFCRDSHP